MVSQRVYLYDRFVSLNDRFTDLLNHRTKQKLMIEKTFEKKWADNRQRLLQEDEEYQRIAHPPQLPQAQLGGRIGGACRPHR